MTGLRASLARVALRHAQARLARSHADWAQAMAAESDHLSDDGARLAWALGCAGASYRAVYGPALLYAGALALGVAAMLLSQWTADEGVGTLVVLTSATLALGLMRPDRALTSGLTVGAVVAAVHAFSAVSGIQPSYEDHPHGLVHGLLWLVLAPPAVAAAALGGRLGLRLHRSF